MPVRCDADGTFHGWGEQYNQTDQRGEAFPLIVSEQGIGRDGSLRQFTGDAHTSYFPMPWYVDARGFGVLVETDYRVEVDLCASDEEVAWLEVVGDEVLAWTVVHGPTPMEVVQRLGEHVGRPTAPPEWAAAGAGDAGWTRRGRSGRVREALMIPIPCRGRPHRLWLAFENSIGYLTLQTGPSPTEL